VAPSERYIVHQPRRKVGIGTRLLNLAGAVWLAKREDRIVIADWRNCFFLADPSLNYFSVLFEPTPVVLGVPLLVAPTAEHVEDHPDARLGSPGASEARVVVSQTKALRLTSPAPELSRRGREDFLRAFYAALEPLPAIARSLHDWWQEHLAGHVVVALNVATGNGYFEPGREYAGRVNHVNLQARAAVSRCPGGGMRARCRGRRVDG
jgi:hypothetical protein